MLKWVVISLLICFPLLFSHCNEDSEEPDLPKISNLIFEPDRVAIKLYENKSTINGFIDFQNAKNGVDKLRLTNSAGADITIAIPDPAGPVTDPVTNGTLTGAVEFIMPTEPATFTFEVWIIDKAGRESNRLNGKVDIVIDGTGQQWNVASAGINSKLNGIVWGNKKFVAVGENGSILTSSNGMSWINQTSGTTHELLGVTWSGTQYIAVGDKGTILTSPDGITWTPRAPGQTTSTLFSVAWGGERFTAVGNKFGINETEIMNSSDGITWTNNPFTVANSYLFGVTWSGAKWIAVGYKPNASLVLSSPDGITWSDISIDNGGYTLFDVTWTGNRFVAVGLSITATSVDGITWTSKLINGAWGLRGVAASPSTILAVGNGVFYSVDGLNWTEGNAQVMGHQAIAWSGVEFAVVGNPNYIYLSP